MTVSCFLRTFTASFQQPVFAEKSSEEISVSAFFMERNQLFTHTRVHTHMHAGARTHAHTHSTDPKVSQIDSWMWKCHKVQNIQIGTI
jgi:hypothetical protein